MSKAKKLSFCCEELSEATQYDNSSFSPVSKKTMLLYIGSVKTSPKDAEERAKRLLKAMGPGAKKVQLPKKFSGVIPILKPIHFCPFCSKQFKD